jgi:hypothetical protein
MGGAGGSVKRLIQTTSKTLPFLCYIYIYILRKVIAAYAELHISDV